MIQPQIALFLIKHFVKVTVQLDDIQNHVMDKMDKLLQGLAIANDINYDLNYIKGYLPVHNNEKAYELLRSNK